MRRRTCLPARAVSSAAIILVVTTVALAQSWQGGATLGLSVRTSKGAPVSDALVTLAYRDIGFGDGPPPRLTDGQGEVNFTGLSTGTWSLRVDHPDHLSYLATVVVRQGKKPQTLTEFLEATGTGRLTLKIKMLKGVAGDKGTPVEAPRTASAPPPTPEPEQPTAVAETTKQAAGETPAEATDTPLSAQDQETQEAVGTTETVAEVLPAVTPEVAAPAASADVPPAEPVEVPTDQGLEAPQAPAAAVQVDRVPAPEVDTPESGVIPAADALSKSNTSAPLPETPREDPALAAAEPEDSATPTQVPVPGPATVSLEPSPEPEPDSETEPGPPIDPPASATHPLPVQPLVPDRRSLRSYKDRSCLECKPGEWSATAVVEVPGASETCATVSESDIRKLLGAAALEHSTRLADYVGSLPPDALPEELAALSRGSCRLVVLVMPRGARFTGFKFQASDVQGRGDCIGDQECAIGGASWLFNPGIARTETATVIFSVFHNSAETTERTATLTGYFVPSPGWAGGL